ncbi:MAG: universal stress protein [Acidobacteriota bacterium]|nr:universal stress protein [Acidobacteriota bacterium]
MFDRILIPVDFSAGNRDSIAQAARLAHAETSVTLIHIIQMIDHLEDDEDEGFYSRLREMADRKMESLLKYGRELGLNLSHTVLVGKRTTGILTYAREHDISIIVLNSRPMDWTQPLEGFGGTSHAVAVYAHCPVFLIK